ncbi:hypothetical protein [Antarctobacter sp.]|uniref:hypothetical protein n=1 Tax=Antarctobacter sp. TaxID=1872577 RepID=UPI003A8F2595
MHRSHTDSPDVAAADLLPFLVLAFGLAWGAMLLLILFPETVAGIFGPVSARNPLFKMTVYAPAVAAGVLVVARTGLSGLLRFLERLRLWRVAVGCCGRCCSTFS